MSGLNVLLFSSLLLFLESLHHFLVHLFLLLSCSLSCGGHLVVFLFFTPHWEVTLTLHVSFRETEELEGCEHEFFLSLDGANELRIISWVLVEEVRRLNEIEVSEPGVNHLVDGLSVKGLDFLFILEPFLDLLDNIFGFLDQIFLKSDSLSDSIASHSLLFHLFEESDSLLLSLNLFTPDEVLSSLSNGVHVLGFQ